MLTRENKEFFSEVADKYKELAKLALREYRPQANAIIKGVINNENEINLILDNMLSFCYDDEILKLYKSVIRSIINKYLESVHDHVYEYYFPLIFLIYFEFIWLKSILKPSPKLKPELT